MYVSYSLILLLYTKVKLQVSRIGSLESDI